MLLMKLSALVMQALKKKCKNKIKDLIKSGVTVLFVSHNKDNVEEVCTRAIYLKSGTVICDGKVEDVLKVYESKNKNKLVHLNIFFDINKP